MTVKAFDLVPVLDRVALSETQNLKIQCIESCGSELFIGTYEGIILHYSLEEKKLPNGKKIFSCIRRNQIPCGSRKPICDLRYFSAIGRLLVLTDRTLIVLECFEFKGSAHPLHKIKDVIGFSVNENPTNGDPLCIQICVNKEKQFHIYSISEDDVTCILKQSCPEIINELEIDGDYVCLALMSHYAIYDVNTAHMQSLFSYDIETVNPLVRKIYRGEFLLAGPGNLGIFATTEGISTRPPLNWEGIPIAVCSLHPYVLVLKEENIHVFSVFDQSKKQFFEFNGGAILGNWEGRIFVCSNQSVYALLPVPISKQIEGLLDDGLLDEAVKIAESSERNDVIRNTIQKAGFLYLSRGSYAEAAHNLIQGNVDVREVISLFPGLLSSTCTFTRSVPPLHSMPDITIVTKGDAEEMKNAKSFLADFLLEAYEDVAKGPHIQEVDTVLVKLLAEVDPFRLQKFLEHKNVSCNTADVLPILTSHSLYHAAATLMFNNGEEHKSFNLWHRILSGELEDESYPGFDKFVKDLAKCKDEKIIWLHAEFVLAKDPDAGVKIFIDSESGNIEPDAVVSFIEGHKTALKLYLEHLVKSKEHQREQYHTQLALIYIDELLKSPEDKAAQKALEMLLEKSSLYRPTVLLERLEGTEFHKEQALLYGRLQKHEKALDILVNKQKDFLGAEKYCQTMSTEKYPKSTLHLLLLQIYLNSGNEDALEPTLNLLKRASLKGELRADQVLPLLPDTWSLSMLQTFLRSSLQQSHHEKNRRHIEARLSRQQNLNCKLDFYNAQKEPIRLREHSYCCVCKKTLSGSVFARYPNGVQTHVQCAHHPHICPLTGTVFSVTSGSSQ